MEPDEGIEKLAGSENICKLYCETFYDRRAHLDHYFKEQPTVQWSFQPSLVFFRLDSVMSHLRLIQVKTS